MESEDSMCFTVEPGASRSLPLTETRNYERPRVLRPYRRAMDRFTERESPSALLHLVSDRQHNSRRLDEQEHFPRRVLVHFTGSRKLAKILIPEKSQLASEWIPGDTN
jgi:hypothetical protein